MSGAALTAVAVSSLSATVWLMSAVLGLALSVPIRTTCSALTGSEDVLIGLTVVTVVSEL